MKTPSMMSASEPEQPATGSIAGMKKLITPYLKGKDGPSRYSVRDILRNGFDDYIREHPVSFHTQKVIHALMACGTGNLGYSLCVCPECRTIQMYTDKCGSRYCPSCGYLRQLRWIEERRSELIQGIPYYHVVFTVPHVLNSLIFQNQKVLLNHLFRSASTTVLELSAEKAGAVPGLLMVLHTFGSALTLHYHIHMLVSGGGLSEDKKSFRLIGSENYFLPVEVMEKRFQSLFLEGLKDLHDRNQLEYFGEAEKLRNSYEWSELLSRCYGLLWNIEIRSYQSLSGENGSPLSASDFPRYVMHDAVSPEAVHSVSPEEHHDTPDTQTALAYLSRYTDRSAITDNRIRKWDSQQVSFDYKDYRAGGKKKVMTLSISEFIRRFLLHILPAGVAKIRYGGFLAGCVKAANLARIRELLNQKAPEEPVREMKADELSDHFYGSGFGICPCCGKKMLSAGRRVSLKQAADTVLNYAAVPS